MVLNKRSTSNNISSDSSDTSIYLKSQTGLLLPQNDNKGSWNKGKGYPSKRTIFITIFLSAIVYSVFTQIMDKQNYVAHSDSLNKYDQAIRESNGFFDDITNFDWKLMKDRVKHRQNHKDPQNPTEFIDHGGRWYQENFEPDFTCQHERRVGGMGDGPKWVCDPHRIKSFSDEREKNGGNGCLVYSIGSHGDFTFENGLLEILKRNNPQRNLKGSEEEREETLPCEIHTFDPYHHSDKATPGIHYHSWGLKGTKSEIKEPNFKTLEEIVAALGHEGHVVDIFKIDCEECEWETYQDWFASNITMLQILVEVHGTPTQVIDFFETMQKNDYVTFHKEPNTMGSDGRLQEYAMLKLDPSFIE